MQSVKIEMFNCLKKFFKISVSTNQNSIESIKYNVMAKKCASVLIEDYDCSINKILVFSKKCKFVKKLISLILARPVVPPSTTVYNESVGVILNKIKMDVSNLNQLYPNQKLNSENIQNINDIIALLNTIK